MTIDLGSVVPAITGRLRTDDQALAAAADDWGHVVNQRPVAVLEPGSDQDVVAMVRFAAERGLPLVARGGGHSCYGQSQTDGVVVDMTSLARVHELTPDTITVAGGTLWSEVLATTLPAGLTPPVLTDYPHTSVAGTLSVGGIGGATQHHGMQTDTVLAMDVVTGTGDLVACSPDHNRELFDAVRAGLGQSGIILRATLRLTPAPSHARRYLLRYQNLARYLADQRRMAADGRFHYLEGQLVDDETGHWQPMIEAAEYYTAPDVPDDTALLADLAHDRGTAEIEDLTYWDFLNRVAPGEELLRATGEWFHPHPWVTVFVPDTAVERLVAGALRGLTRAEIGNSGLILLYPFRTTQLRTPQVRVPSGEITWLFAILRAADPHVPGLTDAMIAANRAIYDQAIAAGATGYPINTFPMTDADWQTHFGRTPPTPTGGDGTLAV